MAFDFEASEDAMERQRILHNPPSHTPGFGGDRAVSSFDDDDDDDDDDFGGTSFGGGLSSGFGGFGSPTGLGSSGSFGAPSGMNSFGGSPGFGARPMGQGGPFGSSYGFGAQQEQEEKKEEKKPGDEVFEYAKDIIYLLKDAFVSFRNRNLDDWSDITNQWLTVGGVFSVIGILMTLLGTIGGLQLLKLGGLGGTTFFAGLYTLSGGFCGLGICTYLRSKSGDYADMSDDVSDIQALPSSNAVDLKKFVTEEDEDEEDDYGIEDEDESDESAMSNLLTNLLTGGKGEEEDMSDNFIGLRKETVEEVEDKVDFNRLLDNVREDVGLVTRRYLFDSFSGFFPTCSKDFSTVKHLDLDSDIAITIGANINRAIEQLLPNVPAEVREVELLAVEETHFAYKVEFNRLKGGKTVKPEDLAREMLYYFKSDINDTSVSITVDTLGDSLIAVITKGAKKTGVVTVGDCFTKTSVVDYILDEGNKLPFISGITELGEVIMSDMSQNLSLLITGQPRSGKSWYVNSILSTITAFNSPEDIQFIVIDPKKTALFKTFSLLPHVAGVHDSSDVLGVLREIVEVEGPRRKQLQEDEMVDSIWELRKKGIKLPSIMIVIDEVVAIMNKLKPMGLDSEFKLMLQTIFTEFPYIGIGVMLVPHRTTGVIDKTVRLNASYIAAVMADEEALKEEVGVTKWGHPLVAPGDMAIKCKATGRKAIYLKGTGLALGEDSNTREVLTNLAKAWYKTGVDIPDMTNLGSACNRDEGAVKEILQIGDGSNRIQYNANNLDL